MVLNTTHAEYGTRYIKNKIRKQRSPGKPSQTESKSTQTNKICDMTLAARRRCWLQQRPWKRTQSLGSGNWGGGELQVETTKHSEWNIHGNPTINPKSWFIMTYSCFLGCRTVEPNVFDGTMRNQA